MIIKSYECSGCKLVTWSHYDLNGKVHIECSAGDGSWEEEAAQHSVHLNDGGLSEKWASTVNSLCLIIIDASGKKYVSSNDLDFANDVLDAVIPLLTPPIGK